MQSFIINALRLIFKPILWLLRVAQARIYLKRRMSGESWQAKQAADWDAKCLEARLPPARGDKGVIKEFINISAQPQCSFFRNLPAELRTIIYEYALSVERLHLEIVTEEKNGKEFLRMKCPDGKKLVAFPRSCKLAYMESIKVVYASNTFQIRDMMAYFYFKQVLPTHFLNTIQAIHIIWANTDDYAFEYLLHSRPPLHLSYWNRAWQEMSKMKGLKHVRADFEAHLTAGLYDSEEGLLFSPLAAAYRDGLEGIHVFFDSRWDKHRIVQPGHTGPVEREWPFPVTRGCPSQDNPPLGDFSWVNELDDESLPVQLR